MSIREASAKGKGKESAVNYMSDEHEIEDMACQVDEQDEQSLKKFELSFNHY
ncbi:hypothetical protein ACHAPC_011006, partial [Botrytis cinerea]